MIFFTYFRIVRHNYVLIGPDGDIDGDSTRSLRVFNPNVLLMMSLWQEGIPSLTAEDDFNQRALNVDTAVLECGLMTAFISQLSIIQIFNYAAREARFQRFHFPPYLNCLRLFLRTCALIIPNIESLCKM